MIRFAGLSIAALGLAASFGFMPGDTQAYTVRDNVECPVVVREDEILSNL